MYVSELNSKEEELVCAILVNYNGKVDTEECVKSILNCEYSNIKIIIVDNASSYDSLEYNEIINKEKCNIIYSKENVGFAGANNIGIKYAKLKYCPKYYLIINNDTVVSKNFLQPLISKFKENSNVGIATSKIYYYNEPELLWFGGSYFDKTLCEFKIYGIGEKDSEKYSIEKDIPFATACLWLLADNVIEEVGLINEEYFLYYEDADYCMRIREKGYSIEYVPKSIIYHKESRSTKKGSDLYYYYNTRNYLIFISKFCDLSHRIRVYSNRLIRSCKDVLRKRRSVKNEWKAWYDFVFKKRGQLK